MSRAWGPAVAVVALLLPSTGNARGARAFMEWLRTQSDVLTVRVTSSSMPPSVYETRFRAPPPDKGTPGMATTWVRHRSNSRLCLVRGSDSVCVAIPPAEQLWPDYELWKFTKTGTRRVYLLGSTSADSFATYELRMPEKAVREGLPRKRNPAFEARRDAPWWGFSFGKPCLDETRFPDPGAPPVSPVPGPPWLAHATSFAVTPMSDGKVLLVQDFAPPASWACVHDAAWTCHALPAPRAVDAVHPGMRPTDRRLPPQPPAIYRITAAGGALAVEWSWIRSTVARTPSMELVGAWVELLEARPGQVASRRGVLELEFGRLTQTRSDSFLQTRAISPDCLEVTEVGKPSPIRLVSPGRFCAGSAGPGGKLRKVAQTGTQ